MQNTANGERCLIIVDSFVLLIIYQRTNEELQFIQDGAPPESVLIVCACLDTHSCGGRIGCRGPTERPLRHFSSCGQANDKIYSSKPRTLDEIPGTSAAVPREVLINSAVSLSYRL
jgi:hypothetical protein